MRIAVVGGVERNEGRYIEIAARHGHELVFHGGHLTRRTSDALDDLIAGVDLVIVVTEVNSHNAVIVARQSARRHNVPIVLHRRLSHSKLAAIAAGLQSPQKAAG